jgi:uncharacterized phage protein (TIGR01671 family)
MNRPTKFRVWDKITNQYLQELGIYYWHIPYSLDGEEITGEANLVGLSELLKHDNFVIQQYTGLTDSNDVPIYEGDIVKYNPDKPNIERIGIIEFSNYYKGWAIKDSHCYPLSDFGVYSLASPFLSFNWTEIVGNIFEHENLLK